MVFAWCRQNRKLSFATGGDQLTRPISRRRHPRIRLIHQMAETHGLMTGRPRHRVIAQPYQRAVIFRSLRAAMPGMRQAGRGRPGAEHRSSRKHAEGASSPWRWPGQAISRSLAGCGRRLRSDIACCCADIASTGSILVRLRDLYVWSRHRGGGGTESQ